MPQLTWSQSVAAGGTFDPLDAWNHQYPIANCVFSLMQLGVGAGLLATFTALDTQILQEAPVSGGGVGTTLPTVFTAQPIPGKAQKGARLSIRYRNPTGGALVVNGVIDITYAGGKK